MLTSARTHHSNYISTIQKSILVHRGLYSCVASCPWRQVIAVSHIWESQPPRTYQSLNVNLYLTNTIYLLIAGKSMTYFINIFFLGARAITASYGLPLKISILFFLLITYGLYIFQLTRFEKVVNRMNASKSSRRARFSACVVAYYSSSVLFLCTSYFN